MDKKIFVTLPLVILAIITMTTTTHAFAHHDNGGTFDDSAAYYTAGWNDGGLQAQSDWDSGQFAISSGGNSICPDGHSHSYCQGFNAGYANEWNKAIANNNAVQQGQSQGAQCNIKGDNNQCNIQQGQSAISGAGTDGVTSGVPRCLAFCSVIH